jgi:hypothetical protein
MLCYIMQGVIGISDIIVKPGLINVDFADVRSVMGGAGTALMGIGRGRYIPYIYSIYPIDHIYPIYSICTIYMPCIPYTPMYT